MSADMKKIMWIVVGALLLGLAATAVIAFSFTPRKGQAMAPASAGGGVPARSAEPDDFIDAPPPLAATDDASGDQIIIVYGEVPDPAKIPGSPTGAAGSVGAAVSSGAAAPGLPGAPVIPGALGAPVDPSLSAPAIQPSGTRPVAPVAPPAPAPKPVAKPATAPKPAAAPAPKKVSVTEYWIQAASFTSRARADELKRLMAAKGLAATVTVKDVDGKSYYRVRVGPYASKPEAEAWLVQVKKLEGCVESYVSKTVVERTR